jgi:large subunit ribosomal protein L25
MIDAEPRERTGSRYAERLRKVGRLPGVIYGHKTAPVSVSVDEKELLTHVGHGAHVINLKIDGEPEMCLVKALQYGYLGDNVIHVDFARVNMQEEVTVHVHLNFVGTPDEAHHAGAILKHDLTELTIRCKVSAIPEEIKVDLSKMEGTVLAAADLELPAGIELAENETATVCSISFVRKEEEVGEEVAVEAEAAEPEVITESKPDEETEESGA